MQTVTLFRGRGEMLELFAARGGLVRRAEYSAGGEIEQIGSLAGRDAVELAERLTVEAEWEWPARPVRRHARKRDEIMGKKKTDEIVVQDAPFAALVAEFSPQVTAAMGPKAWLKVDVLKKRGTHATVHKAGLRVHLAAADVEGKTEADVHDMVAGMVIAALAPVLAANASQPAA